MTVYFVYKIVIYRSLLEILSLNNVGFLIVCTVQVIIINWWIYSYDYLGFMLAYCGFDEL